MTQDPGSAPLLAAVMALTTSSGEAAIGAALDDLDQRGPLPAEERAAAARKLVAVCTRVSNDYSSAATLQLVSRAVSALDEMGCLAQLVAELAGLPEESGSAITGIILRSRSLGGEVLGHMLNEFFRAAPSEVLAVAAEAPSGVARMLVRPALRMLSEARKSFYYEISPHLEGLARLLLRAGERKRLCGFLADTTEPQAWRVACLGAIRADIAWALEGGPQAAEVICVSSPRSGVPVWLEADEAASARVIERSSGTADAPRDLQQGFQPDTQFDHQLGVSGGLGGSLRLSRGDSRLLSSQAAAGRGLASPRILVSLPAALLHLRLCCMASGAAALKRVSAPSSPAISLEECSSCYLPTLYTLLSDGSEPVRAYTCSAVCRLLQGVYTDKHATYLELLHLVALRDVDCVREAAVLSLAILLAFLKSRAPVDVGRSVILTMAAYVSESTPSRLRAASVASLRSVLLKAAGAFLRPVEVPDGPAAHAASTASASATEYRASLVHVLEGALVTSSSDRNMEEAAALLCLCGREGRAVLIRLADECRSPRVRAACYRGLQALQQLYPLPDGAPSPQELRSIRELLIRWRGERDPGAQAALQSLACLLTTPEGFSVLREEEAMEMLQWACGLRGLRGLSGASGAAVDAPLAQSSASLRSSRVDDGSAIRAESRVAESNNPSDCRMAVSALREGLRYFPGPRSISLSHDAILAAAENLEAAASDSPQRGPRDRSTGCWRIIEAAASCLQKQLPGSFPAVLELYNGGCTRLRAVLTRTCSLSLHHEEALRELFARSKAFQSMISRTLEKEPGCKLFGDVVFF